MNTLAITLYLLGAATWATVAWPSPEDDGDIPFIGYVGVVLLWPAATILGIVLALGQKLSESWNHGRYGW